MWRRRLSFLAEARRKRASATIPPMPTEQQIRPALTSVIDPELRKNIVELGMVRSIERRDDGRVDVTVSLTTPGCPIRSHFQTAVSDSVMALEGVTAVGVDFDVLSDTEKQSLQQRLGRGALPQGALARVKNVICVGSGKGGVGKSTVTVNLAAALQLEGMQTSVMDADVWGYSIPRMLGVHGRPMVTGDHPRKIIPLDGPGGVQSISPPFHGVRVPPATSVTRPETISSVSRMRSAPSA